MNILDFIQQSDLRNTRFGFYKLVYIRPTQLCPARCRHCSAKSEPGAGSTTSLEELAKWVPSIVSIPGVEWVGVEGGEPFFVLPQLRLILQTALAYGVSTSVVTNAYWATDELSARKILQTLPRINFLVISADEFHEEYIPVQRVTNAIKAARPYVDRLAVQTCVGPAFTQFLTRFHEQAGSELWRSIDVIEAPLAYIGRASETGIMAAPESTSELPNMACLFLGTPVLREDGVFVACCQQDAVLSRKPNLFQLGNLNERSAAEFRALVDSDIYFQTLRVFGPRMVAEAAVEFHWGWEPHPYQRGNDCELCMHLASHPRVVEGFRKAFDTPEHRKKIALGRSILFAEPLSIPTL